MPMKEMILEIMDTSSPRVFINAEVCKKYIGQRVRAVVKVLELEDEGLIVGEATDGRLLYVKDVPDLPLSHYVEVFGIAEDDESIRAEIVDDYGEQFDTVAYNALVGQHDKPAQLENENMEEHDIENVAQLENESVLEHDNDNAARLMAQLENEDMAQQVAQLEKESMPESVAQLESGNVADHDNENVAQREKKNMADHDNENETQLENKIENWVLVEKENAVQLESLVI